MAIMLVLSGAVYKVVPPVPATTFATGAVLTTVTGAVESIEIAVVVAGTKVVPDPVLTVVLAAGLVALMRPATVDASAAESAVVNV
jgi:hypothetical protein